MLASLLLIECELPSEEKACRTVDQYVTEIILLDYFAVVVLLMLIAITCFTIPVSPIVLSLVIVLALLGLLLVTCIDLIGVVFAIINNIINAMSAADYNAWQEAPQNEVNIGAGLEVPLEG